MLARLATDRRQFAAFRTAISELPTPTADYEQLNADMRRAAAGFVRVDDLYIRGYNSPPGKKGDDLLTAGDAQYARAYRIYKAATDSADETYGRLGGSTFGKQLGLDELQKKLERIKQKYGQP